MVQPPSPVVAGWELVLRLRERRTRMGIEVKDITRELGFSRNYWSAVENERKILSLQSMTKILDLLEFDEEERRELFALRETAKERGWWAHYSGIFDDELQRLFGLEHGAHSIRGYESLLIPGLLQTADYARAVITPDVTMRQVEVDQRVAVRLRRQERLDGDDSLHLTTIISEAAFRQQIGGPKVLKGQLDHLLDMIERHPDNLDVRVLPFSATACGLFGAATVHLIDFRNSRLPTVVWQETVSTWGVIYDSLQVRDIKMVYNDALKQTVAGRDAVEVIHQCRRALP